MSTTTATTGSPDRRRVALALFLLMVAVLSPWVQMYTVQPRARLVTTRALVEQGTFEVTDYAAELGVDRVEVGDRIYGDKAPAQPVAAMPFYWVADRLGFADEIHERATDCCAEEPFVAQHHIGAWWLSLFFTVLPAAALCGLMYLHVEEWFPRRAVGAALSISLTTLLLPFSTRLYAHALAALVGYTSWHVLRRLQAPPRAVLAAGALAGLAVTIEYTTGIVLVVLAAALAARRQLADAARFLAGAIPAGLALAWYHTAVFGHPFRTSYGVKSELPENPIAIRPPQLDQAIEIFLGAHGLIYAPIVLLGLYGLVRLLRRDDELRIEAAVSLAVFVAFWALQAAWPNPWGGNTPGPRYMIPALPFLAIGVAASWSRLVTGAAIVIGGATMGLATSTLHMLYPGERLFTGHLRNLSNFGMTPTIYGIWWTDGVGLAVTAALVAAAAWHLWRTCTPSRPTERAVPASEVAA